MKGNAKLPVLEDGGRNLLFTDHQKAEAFAVYFSSTVSASNMTKVMPSISFSDRPHHRLSNIIFDHKDVMKYLQALKDSSSIPFDGIPQIVFKKCAKNLCKPLSMIFNISFMFHTVPSMWKEALVTPIPKVANSNTLLNYRPNSITPTPIKIKEKIIREKLINWLDRCKLLPSEQHGFLRGSSTTTQLLDSTSDWYWALNRNLSVDII